MGDAAIAVKMPTVSLQSKDHEDLLNIIDDLRSQGISRYIDLPQIIVCGDQSSGKSSVLEAVSGLRFPTKDNLCTRFATELILRRGPSESATVTIIPDVSRPDEERRKLQEFEVPTSSIDDDFAKIIEDAEKAMGIDSNTKAFSKDLLRVELSGPKQPHLTLVDLPVKGLVQSYMKKSRSIILAVVSAKNDYANQIVTKYARDLDPRGYRTLGIITKPDTLHAGSDSEKAFVDLAENKDVHFRLGWHVLKNRDYDSRHCSADERDASEEQFFSKGIWTSLPPGKVGIGSLKLRLSRVLKDQILSELPSLIEDVERGVKECEDRLSRLGTSRGSLHEQRMYLLRVSQKFSNIVTSAVQGNYADPFFAAPSTGLGYSKRLRALNVNMLLDFVTVMDTKGHATRIVGATLEQRKGHRPREYTRDLFIDKVLELMRRNRGCELPGTFNPMIIGELFYEQSAPWESIAKDFMERMVNLSRTFLGLTLEYTADQATNYSILQNIINPGMEKIKEDLEKQVVSSLAHQQRGHPITFNHYLTETMQKMRDEQWQEAVTEKVVAFLGVDLSLSSSFKGTFNVKSFLESLTKRTQADMDRYACSEVINCMQAYYKVAKKFFIDDFSVHCIEECLIKKLPGLFCPETAMSLDDSVIENIAAESEESKAERESCNKKLAILTKTLKVLHRLDRHNPRNEEKNGEYASEACSADDSFELSLSYDEENEFEENDEEKNEE